MTNKTYIGTTPDGERVFIGWELKTKNDKPVFSASGYYLNAAGTDHSMGGQCLDSIINDFPENKQAKQIHDVWAQWHLNDMNAGSPKQNELIETVIKPKFESHKDSYNKALDHYQKLNSKLVKLIEKSKYNRYQKTDKLMVDLIELIKARDFDKLTSTHFMFCIDGKGVKNGLGSVQGYIDFSIYKSDCIDIKSLFTTKDVTYPNKYKLDMTYPTFDYSYIYAELEKLGRLRDPDFFIDGQAYKYGSKWLHNDLPADVIKQIESWEEVPEPDEPTLVQQFIIDNDVTLSQAQHAKNEDDWQASANKWTVTVNGSDFDYFTGQGIDTNDKQSILESAISCLMRDAQTGLMDDPIEYLMDELGYEDYKEANKIANACISTATKLGDLYDDNLVS